MQPELTAMAPFFFLGNLVVVVYLARAARFRGKGRRGSG